MMTEIQCLTLWANGILINLLVGVEQGFRLVLLLRCHLGNQFFFIKRSWERSL